MIYGYARVSSLGQAEYGTSLDNQEQKLRDAGAQVIYKDTYTGTKLDRPEFSKLKEILRSGDTLVVTRLDRFARTASEGDKLIGELLDKGVTVNILDMGVLDNSTIGKMIRIIFLAFAEFERNTIMERMNEGKRIKKERGELVEGRPSKFSDKFAEKFTELYAKHASGEISIGDACKELGICRASWYNYCKLV